MYRDTDHPHYVELVKAQERFEAVLNEYLSLSYPKKPEKPGFFDFKGKKEYKQKLNDFSYAEIRYSNKRKELYQEIHRIADETKLNYIL